MEPEIKKEDELEIDLMELLFYLLSKAGYILFAGILFAVISMAVTIFMITPKYTSSTSMYVLNRQTSESITNSDLQSSTYLTKDYMEIIRSRTVLETVIADLDLNTTFESLSGVLEVTTATDTRIITIRVTDADPYAARDIAEQIRIVAGREIQRVMNTEAVNVVDEASIPTKQSSPNLKKNVMIAALAGLFLCCALFVVQYMVNDKIVTAEDVERYLGLSILGELPVDEEELKEKKKRKKKNGNNMRKINRW